MTEADDLFDKKAVDRDYLLGAYEYPDAQAIADRMRAKIEESVDVSLYGRKIGMEPTEHSLPPSAQWKPDYEAARKVADAIGDEVLAEAVAWIECLTLVGVDAHTALHTYATCCLTGE